MKSQNSSNRFPKYIIGIFCILFVLSLVFLSLIPPTHQSVVSEIEITPTTDQYEELADSVPTSAIQEVSLGTVDMYIRGVKQGSLSNVSVSCFSVDGNKHTTLQTNEEGYVRFDALTSGEYIFEASKANYLQFKRSRCQIHVNDKSLSCSLELVPASSLKGKIVSKNNESAIPQAVFVMKGFKTGQESSVSPYPSQIEIENEKEYEFSLKSDEQGEFFVPELFPGEYESEISAEGYLLHSESVQIEGNQICKFFLTTRGLIRGVIVDDDQQPMFLANIVLQKITGEGIVLVSDITTQDGSFQFQDLASGRYRISASHTQSEAAFVEVDLVQDQEDVVLVLKRKRYQIQGQLIQQLNHQPVVGVEVALLPSLKRGILDQYDVSQSERLTAISDESGWFIFDNVKSGSYFLTLNCLLDAASEWTFVDAKFPNSFSALPGFPLEITDQNINDLLLLLICSSALNGMVYDEAQNLTPEATVWAEYLGSSRQFPRIQADEKGAFNYPLSEILSLNLDETVRLYANHKTKGKGYTSLTTEELSDSQQSVEIHLNKGTGKVFGLVTIDGKVSEKSGNVQIIDELERFQTTIDVEGNYSIEGVDEGPFTIVFTHDQCEPVYRTSEISETQSNVRIDVDLSSKGDFSISGYVTDQNGAPLQGVQVLCRNWNIIYDSTQTNESGFYEITELNSGKYDLFFKLNADSLFVGQKFGVQAGEQNVNITLGTKSYKVTGHLFFTDWSPVPGGAFIALYNSSDISRSIMQIPVNNDGSFSFELNQAGHYILLFEAPTKKLTAENQFTLSNTSPSEIYLPLTLRNESHKKNVVIHYTNNRNIPYERFICLINGINHPYQHPGIMGYEGRLSFMVPPGYYNLTFLTPNHQPFDYKLFVQEDVNSLIVVDNY